MALLNNINKSVRGLQSTSSRVAAHLFIAAASPHGKVALKCSSSMGIDGAPDLRVGDAMRRHRVTARRAAQRSTVADGAADIRVGVAGEVAHHRLAHHDVGKGAGMPVLHRVHPRL
eukprot:scaffold55608_cov67-Phaeocystis_antarctica.AAC.7